MAEQAEQKQDYKNAMMYYKEILAIAPKSSKTLEAIKHMEDIESMFSDLKMMTYMGFSESEIISKFGRPDRIVEFGPKEIRFIYGETRAGFIGFSDTYRRTESFMVTFKEGKAVQLTQSFYGEIKYNAIKGFSKLGKYINSKIKSTKPVEKSYETGAIMYLTWKNSKYEYQAMVIKKDINSRIEDYYLLQYEITTRK